MNATKQITPAYALIFLVGLGYMLGVLNTYHRFPSTANMYPNLVAIMVSACGLLYWYKSCTVQRWNLSALAWLLVLILIAVQPFINTITYPDGMIFDLSVVLSCAALSLCIANIDLLSREKLYRILVYFLIITAILTVITQILQYLKLDLPRSIIFPNFSKSRIGSNLSQPNQAAFVLSLGVAGLLYLSNISQRLGKSVLLLISIILLALGLGLSASRTGIVLMLVVLLSYVVLFRTPIRQKLLISTTAISFLVIGYMFGSVLLESYSSVAVSGMDRVSDSTLSLRWYQLQQAAIMFKDDPLTGVGWGNLLGASVDYAQVLPWFSATAHTHFFISQIAVETGVIGLMILIPFVYILIKNFSFKLADDQAAVYTMLAVFIAYSCSEFPLWLPMFLIVFVILLSLIDTSRYSLPKPLMRLNKYGFLTFSIALLIGSVYYQVQYRNYSKVHYALTESTFSQEEKIARLSDQPPVFGFSQFDELFLFYLMSEDQVGLEYKLELTDKVLTQSVSYFTMAKSANIYLLAGEKEKALVLYKAACVFKNAQDCPKLAYQMDKNADKGGIDLQWVNSQFQAWRQAKPKKTGAETIFEP